jgi:hypothetical protein
MSQVPALLSTKRAAYSMHIFSQDLRGSDSPRAYRLPSIARICAYQVSQPLLHQIYSTWPDVPSLVEVGRCGSARHNSTGRRDSPGTINHLRETSEGEARLETSSPADKEAPRRPWGLHRVPDEESSLPIDGRPGGTPLNQPTLQSWVGSH